MKLVKQDHLKEVYKFIEKVEIMDGDEIKNSSAIGSDFVYSLNLNDGYINGKILFLNNSDKETMDTDISKLFQEFEFNLDKHGGLIEITNKQKILENIDNNIFEIIKKYPDESINIYNFLDYTKKLIKNENQLELVNSGKGSLCQMFPEIFNVEFNDCIIISKIYFDVINNIPIPVKKTYKLLEENKEYILFEVFSEFDREKISEVTLLIDLKVILDIPRENDLRFILTSHGNLKVNKKTGLILHSYEKKEIQLNQMKKTIIYELTNETVLNN